MRRDRRRRTAGLDITPLIDVMFMLVIFFVLTASFVNGRISVDLPHADIRGGHSEAVATVTIAGDGSVLWNGESVTDAELGTLAQSVKGRGVVLAGDKNASYGRVSQVLAVLYAQGVTEAGLLMQSDGP